RMKVRFAADRNRNREWTFGFDAAERWRSDANDFKGMPIELNRFSENVRVAAKMILPEGMADDGDRTVAAAAMQIVFAIKDASAIGGNAKHVEHFAADPEAVDDLLFALLRQIEAISAVSKNAFERILMIANALPKRIREVFIAADVEAP